MNNPINPYQTPQSETPNSPVEKDPIVGLGGWLVLVGMGVVLSPIRLLMEFIPTYKLLFENGVWDALTTEGSEAYDSMWAPLLITEIVYNILLIIASLYLIYLFFSKHHFFPKLYIYIMVSSVLFILLDAWLVTKVVPSASLFDPETSQEFTRSLIGAVIWVPYMLISKRVKATFIEKMPKSKEG